MCIEFGVVVGKIENFLYGKLVYKYFGIFYVEFLVGKLRFVVLKFIRFWLGVKCVIDFGVLCL